MPEAGMLLSFTILDTTYIVDVVRFNRASGDFLLVVRML